MQASFSRLQQNLHVQTRKLASSGPRRNSLTYKGSGGRGAARRLGRAPGGSRRASTPGSWQRAQGPPGAGCSRLTRRIGAGRRGSDGRTGPWPARPDGRAGQAGLRRRGAGVRGGDPSPAERWARDSHPPRQDGDVDRGGARRVRLGGTEGERRQKKASPQNAAARLTFSSRSRRRRPPWRSGARGVFPAGGPRAPSGLSARSVRTRRERSKSRGGVRGGTPPGTARRVLQAALAGLRLGFLLAPRAGLSRPGQTLPATAARTLLASPQTRRLCALRR